MYIIVPLSQLFTPHFFYSKGTNQRFVKDWSVDSIITEGVTVTLICQDNTNRYTGFEIKNHWPLCYFYYQVQIQSDFPDITLTSLPFLSKTLVYLIPNLDLRW